MRSNELIVAVIYGYGPKLKIIIEEFITAPLQRNKPLGYQKQSCSAKESVEIQATLGWEYSAALRNPHAWEKNFIDGKFLTMSTENRE